ncbi:molecular chaperone GrpE [Sinobaca qinghaiensis]|uniref:Protein GrpE n=1 Tax=Sinobaca qinghaiensis TaxID=342944 RepID=A0A419V3J2_9BACL|nr:nucleotide exchange factor GrpE [Sinobaca qinghaiensis]RKD73044.1 molecular chaperone GrpE [Sinobaca qinghaiensis]
MKKDEPLSNEETETVNDEKQEESTEEDTVEIIDNDTSDEAVSEDAQRIEELEAEVLEWKNRSLRTQADLDNVRKRAKDEKVKLEKYRAEKLLLGMMPALDNFERALKAEPEGEEAKSIYKGVEMVFNQLKEAAEAEGLQEMPTVGEMFDPHYHQAVMQVEEEGFESNQIVEELQKGYLLKDKVLRPAMVKVNA